MAAGANCIPLVQKVQRLYTRDMVIETVPSEEGLCKKRSSAASRVGDYGNGHVQAQARLPDCNTRTEPLAVSVWNKEHNKLAAVSLSVWLDSPARAGVFAAEMSARL